MLDKFEDLINEVAKRCDCEPSEIEWYSWPEVFGSTAGPNGGVGGMTLTSFQVYAFIAPGEMSKYCAGRWKRWNGEMMEAW